MPLIATIRFQTVILTDSISSHNTITGIFQLYSQSCFICTQDFPPCSIKSSTSRHPYCFYFHISILTFFHHEQIVSASAQPDMSSTQNCHSKREKTIRNTFPFALYIGLPEVSVIAASNLSLCEFSTSSRSYLYILKVRHPVPLTMKL